MSKVKECVQVAVPVRTAYDQWTQFESFPEFMDGVKSVTQLDDQRLHWVAEIGGKRQEWDAVITHQEPDRRVAWTATSGDPNEGEVTFNVLGPDQTEVNLELTVHPSGALEKAGDALGFTDRQVKEDLENFKKFVESRGAPTGAWRGEIDNPVQSPRGH